MFNSFKLVALVALISTTALGAPSSVEDRNNALDANERRQFNFPEFSSGLPSGGASGFPAFGGFPSGGSGFPSLGLPFPFPGQAGGIPAATSSAESSTATPSAAVPAAAAPSASAVNETSAAVPTAAAPSASAVDETSAAAPAAAAPSASAVDETD
ncbi:hypothetical protein BDQ17DRAFT_1349693 [Cyathus striatus]|nr:hypothetical protein BDQ17DRAFT_1349693 [Cyathus striatus]